MLPYLSALENALLHGTVVVAKLCGAEQKAPPIFGRAAITLGIGPHSSFIYSSAGDYVMAGFLKGQRSEESM